MKKYEISEEQIRELFKCTKMVEDILSKKCNGWQRAAKEERWNTFLYTISILGLDEKYDNYKNQQTPKK